MQDTTIATLETGEQAARKIADLVAERFGDGVAVSLDAGPGNWRVTLYFGCAVDAASVRELAATVAGAAAAGALRFASIAAADWVATALPGSSRWRPAALPCTARTTAPASRETVSASRSKPRSPSAPAITAPRAAACWRSIACANCRAAGGAAPKILDLGTGSGVLAIAAARALHRRILATDIDAAAVRVARANVRLNRVGPLVEVVRAAGVTAPAIRARAPFDLVFANILLEPLQRLAAPLTRIVAPGGCVVLSGLLTAQANAARAAYRGFRLERRIELDGWITLVLVRGG